MLKTFSIITLLFPLIFSRPNLERLLAADYNYKAAGSDWSTGKCSSGNRQSPIDISDTNGPCNDTMVFDLSFDQGVKNFTMFDNDATVRGATTASSLYATDINGRLVGYQSTEIHVRAPSEHRIDGESFDLEVQIVHAITSQFAAKNVTTRTNAIVSILFNVDDSGETHPFIDALSLTAAVGTNKNSTASVNFKTMLSDKFGETLTYYTYEGSFSFPPCEETVNWYVLDNAQTIKATQLTALTARWSGNQTFASGSGNNRAIQPADDRTILRGGDECEEQFVYFFSFVILFIFINYFIFKIL